MAAQAGKSADSGGFEGKRRVLVPAEIGTHATPSSPDLVSAALATHHEAAARDIVS
jgi:hypothetical protein